MGKIKLTGLIVYILNVITVIDLVYPPHMHTKFLPNTIKEKVNEKLVK